MVMNNSKGTASCRGLARIRVNFGKCVECRRARWSQGSRCSHLVGVEREHPALSCQVQTADQSCLPGVPWQFSSTLKMSEVKVTQSWSDSLWPHGLYTVCEILQARILEWVAFPFSKRSSQPRDQTQVSHVAGGCFTSWATREAQECWSG